MADGLRTGVTEWPEPLEAKSAVELMQEFLNGACLPNSHFDIVYFSLPFIFLIENLYLLYLNISCRFWLGILFG